MFYALLAWVAATSLPRLLLVAGAPFDAPEDEELWSLGAGHTPHYSERLVTEGEPFSLSCRLRPGLDAGSWLKDGRSIDAAAGYELREQPASGTSEERVLTLTVRDAQVSHTGEYSCVNGLPFRYHHVIIMPKESSRDLGNPREFNRCITLRLNETLEIPCDLRKGDPAEVRWYRDGRAVGLVGDSRLKLRSDGALVIDAASHTDTGAYRCRSGTRESPLVIVVSPLHIETSSETRVVDAGATVNIDCKVVGGTNTARLSWLVGGVPLASSGSRARLSGFAGVRDSLLTLSDVAPSDSGEYTCRALDGRCPRAAAASTSLHVWPHGVHTNEELPGAGMLIRPFDAQLTLSCWLPDAVESAFNWSKDGVPLTNGDRVSTTGGTLTVKHPGESDAGVYECTLSDSNIKVSIQVRYKVFCYLDWEASVPEPSYWIFGKPARLAVQLTGWPPARIVWLRDGVVLSPSDRVHLEAHNNVSKAVLVVEDAVTADRGNYSCLASNGFDADRFDVMVRVRSRYAFMIPLSGIGIEVCLLVSIIACSELRRRRSRERHRRAREAAPPAAAPVQARGAGKRE
ncbi:protein sax-3-like [Dermacentor andersoni]|uniref:protein sax-3-like n=1 Tax=Dermacentor andersoni TaxID=34620 RepID=UPI0024168FF1|nr:hemicentin-1-like [Dermacentor andersoni]